MPDGGGIGFVFAAYTVTWVVILGWTVYAWRVWKRARTLYLESGAEEAGK